MMPQIRKATIDEIPILLPLVQRYWVFEGLAGFEAFRVGTQLARLLADPRLGCGWIAYVHGDPVGYLLAVYVFSLEHLGLTAEIDEFFVRSEHRGQGAGQALLKAAEVAFFRAGCTNVSLQMSRHHDAARAFYHRQGYSERSGYDLLDKSLQEDIRGASSAGRLPEGPRRPGQTHLPGAPE